LFNSGFIKPVAPFQQPIDLYKFIGAIVFLSSLAIRRILVSLYHDSLLYDLIPPMVTLGSLYVYFSVGFYVVVK